MSNNVGKTILNVLKRIIQIILLFVLVGGILAVVVGAMLGLSMVEVAKNAPEITPENILLTLDQNSEIYDKDGNLIESIAYEEYREIISIDEMPDHLPLAFIALEDERFLSHNGIDPRSIARSFVENLRAGGISQGGSTITQQLVKNVYLSNDVEWERKITEMYLALQVEDVLTKEQIIEAYLNRIFFGQHAYGVEAASQIYFSKPASELNIAQSATLASIVQAPSRFALFSNYTPSTVPEDAEVLGEFEIFGSNYVAVASDTVMPRKDRVLDKMLEMEMITQSEYNEAKNFDVMASVKPSNVLAQDYPSHISRRIKQEAINKIMENLDIPYNQASDLLYTGGLRITTTIDWDVQEKLESAYENFPEFLSEHTKGGQPLLGNLRFDEYGDIVSRGGGKLYYEKSNLLTEDNKIYVPEGWFAFDESGNLTVNSARLSLGGNYINVVPYYTINDSNELVTYRVGSIEISDEYASANEDGGFTISSEFFENIDDFYIIEDGNLIINPIFYTVETVGTVQPQSSTVILDSKTAEVLAIVSKRGNSPDDTIDRATDYHRSPASAFKPISVFAPAIEEGRTLADPVDDTPHSMIGGEAWPTNVFGGYTGINTTRNSLYRSLNPPAVKILEEIGIETSKKYLEKFGIINGKNPEDDSFVTREENLQENDENLSMALGGLSRGVTTMDMASAFQAFANKGQRVESSIISKIESDSLGEIYVNKHEPIHVISEETNFLVTDVLHDIVGQNWVSGRTGTNGIWTGGKTGTSNRNTDFWFTGFNHYYTAASWIGFDNQNLSMDGSSGIASEFFFSYMNLLTEGKESIAIERPSTIVTARVSKMDGKLPSELTSKDPRGSQEYTEYFVEGTVPTEVSDSHITVAIDKRNDLLAPENLPAELIENKVFINRPIAYDPSNFGGIIPTDWIYQAPTKVSNLPVEDVKETQTLSDGSIVETTKKVDGTVITVKRSINGSIVATTKKMDGTVITVTTSPDGVITETITSPDGTVTTTVTEPAPKPVPDPNLQSPGPNPPEQTTPPQPQDPNVQNQQNKQ